MASIQQEKQPQKCKGEDCGCLPFWLMVLQQCSLKNLFAWFFLLNMLILLFNVVVFEIVVVVVVVVVIEIEKVND